MNKLKQYVKMRLCVGQLFTLSMFIEEAVTYFVRELNFT